MHVVFDLDGCLIDSAEVIRRAYRKTGLRPPEDILAQEGVDWVLRQCGPGPLAERLRDRLKERKNAFYLASLCDAPPLPPWNVAARLRGEGHGVGALSGAPAGTFQRLHDTHPALSHHQVYDWCRDGMRTPDKMAFLAQLGTYDDGNVYVDDQTRLVALPPKWRFVHYRGQTEEELWKEITS